MSITAPYRECFLYVDATGVPEITAELSGHLGPPERFDRFAVPGIELEVVKNSRRLLNRPDDFVDWNAIVEVHADTADDADVVAFISRLMMFLRAAGHRVVAACDFEDDLPQTDFR